MSKTLLSKTLGTTNERNKKLNIKLESLIARMVEEFGGSKENAQLWFNSSNTELDGKTPMYFLDRGKFDIIENLIDAIESGQPG
jgi:Protein of unknown function (DUF2384)